MWGILLLSILASTTASDPDPELFPVQRTARAEEISTNEYLLSTPVIPTHYDIGLTVPLEALTGGNTSYDGTVNITLSVTEPTNTVQFHSLVNIISISFTDPSVVIQNYTLNSTKETVSIFLNSNLNTSTTYRLNIQFKGNLEKVKMNGFYRSDYVINGTKEYLATTQFESTHARRAFPCFDEPGLKATFQLTLTHPSEFNAKSNTPSQSQAVAQTTNTTTTVFVQTPKMSTYLIAFVISKYNCTSGTNLGTDFGVCSRTDLSSDRDEALQYGMRILEAFDQYTASPYNLTNLKKLDQFAIPDFSAGAMENWGLVTYREYSLTSNKDQTSRALRQNMLSIIAHEFAHMWFGNLVTTKWWDTTFLNEGFARYFQYFILTKINDLSDFQMDKQFIVEQQQTAFVEDASPSSRSLTSAAWTPAEISNKFNTISYNKGACILRMIENLIGSSTFQTALQNYLNATAYGSGTTEKLWVNFPSNSPALPQNVTFNDFVDNWTNKPGFPVVSVVFNGKNVTFSQKRFLYSGNNKTQWYVPITYRLSNSSSYETFWLAPNSSVTLLNNLTEKDWLIVNDDSRGYYRVKYCTRLTQRIKSLLNQNHTQISELNRAQIIDDSLNLARAGYIKYSEAFELLKYLKNETSYFPWFTTIRNMDYLVTRLGANTELGKRTNAMVLDLISQISANVSSTKWEEIDQVTALKLQRVWADACKRGQASCISETKRLFEAFRLNKTSVNPNIRDVVYCNALRNSNNIAADWEFLWNRLLSSIHPQEDLYILLSLGCTKHKPYLTRLLDATTNSSVIKLQNLFTVWTSVASASKEGLDHAFEYFVNNYKKIIEYYPEGISLLSQLTNRFTSNAEVTKLQQFADRLEKNSTIRSAANSALTTAKQNLQFRSRIEDDLDDYFGIDKSGSPVNSFGILLPLLLLSVALFM
ncbi:unnamed protein product [Diabrotica balteata]|uniref:Aminopeptidase n=1 Tax=Diabrotica balteata TaxID=107213 RepID=A0A9N9SVG3_DIABA|nr:unnamed protein product [Diabrotica balteata]